MMMKRRRRSHHKQQPSRRHHRGRGPQKAAHPPFTMIPNWAVDQIRGASRKYAALDIGVYIILRWYRFVPGGPWSIDEMRKPFHLGRNRFEASLRRLHKAAVLRTKRFGWTGKLMLLFPKDLEIILPDEHDEAGGFFDET